VITKKILYLEGKMKKIAMFFCVVVLVLVALPIYAADRVVVVPLNTSRSGPGNWKFVSVSSLGGTPRTSSTATAQTSAYCSNSIGRYATSGTSEFLVVPIELPNGATIIALTAVICDNTSSHGSSVYLYRSDAVSIAQTSTSVADESTNPFTKTTTSIAPGSEIVDNSKYSYYLYMEINGSVGAGSKLYPISGIVTLQ
jgi:hypothetical protein